MSASALAEKGMRKRDLEMLLSSIPPHPNPKLELEQYATPSHLAARIIWVATFTYRDLPSDFVLDLGAGTGRLGLGAALVGSEYVVLVDIDSKALQVALAASRDFRIDAHVDAVCGDATRLSLAKKASCVLQNPPFGVHRKGADVAFLRVALKHSEKVYSVHKAESVEYVVNKCREEGARAEVLFEEVVRLPPTMPHHYKREHEVRVVVIRAVPFSPQGR